MFVWLFSLWISASLFVCISQSLLNFTGLPACLKVSICISICNTLAISYSFWNIRKYAENNVCNSLLVCIPWLKEIFPCWTQTAKLIFFPPSEGFAALPKLSSLISSRVMGCLWVMGLKSGHWYYTWELMIPIIIIRYFRSILKMVTLHNL